LLFAVTASAKRSGGTIRNAGGVFRNRIVAATMVATVEQHADNRSVDIVATWLYRVKRRF
jgi:hypothetical protein